MDEGPYRDPEFRPAAGPVVSTLRDPDHYGPECYRRLVANPFLACFAWIVWFLVASNLKFIAGKIPLGSALQSSLGPLAIIVGLVMPYRLFQYHCLDCGRTGWLGAWRDHLCPAVQDRRARARPRRFRGPSPLPQLLLWFAAALLCGLLVASLRL